METKFWNQDNSDQTPLTLRQLCLYVRHLTPGFFNQLNRDKSGMHLCAICTLKFTRAHRDQQNRTLEATMVTLHYFTALCLPTGKTREIFDLHFFARQGGFWASHCVVTKVEVPKSVSTCNMRNKFITISVYQAV